jgi:hypothetical protein
VKNDCLIAGGALGVDAARLLECASKEVSVSALLWALLTASELGGEPEARHSIPIVTIEEPRMGTQ